MLHNLEETKKDTDKILITTGKILAVCDVDGTLGYGQNIRGEYVYNKELLDALSENRITDIILFTDMTFDKILFEDRIRLKKYLEENGFRVHCIATVADFAWSIETDTLALFEKRFLEFQIRMEKGNEVNLDKIDELLEEFPEIKRLIEDKTYLPKVGVAFEDACKIDEIENEEKRELEFVECQKKSHRAKLVLDLVAFKRNLPHTKGIMFEQLMKHKPGWVIGSVYFEDKKACIDAVKIVNEKIRHPLITILVCKNHTDKIDYYREKIGKSDIFSLMAVPDAAIILILSFLSAKEKISAGLVCKYFLELVKDNTLWEREMATYFGQRQLADSLRSNILLFSAYRTLSNENRLALKSKKAYEYAYQRGFLADLYINTDTQEIKIKKRNATNFSKYENVNCEDPDLHPVLKNTLNCKGSSNVLNCLEAILDDPYCPKLINKYFIGSDKKGYKELSVVELIQKISDLKKKEALKNDKKPGHSRCSIS